MSAAVEKQRKPTCSPTRLFGGFGKCFKKESGQRHVGPTQKHREICANVFIKGRGWREEGWCVQYMYTRMLSRQ